MPTIMQLRFFLTDLGQNISEMSIVLPPCISFSGESVYQSWEMYLTEENTGLC